MRFKQINLQKESTSSEHITDLIVSKPRSITNTLCIASVNFYVGRYISGELADEVRATTVELNFALLTLLLYDLPNQYLNNVKANEYA